MKHRAPWMTRAAAAAALGAVLVAMNPAPARAETLDEAAAALRVDAAAGLLSSGRPAEALDMAREALRFDPRSSDAAYLQALFLSLSGGTAGEITALCAAALSADRFRAYSRADALRLEARQMIRTRRYPEALRLLGRIGPGLSHDADALYLSAQARWLSGARAEALSLLSAAFSAFPDDTRFPRLLAERCGPLKRDDAAGPLMELALRRAARYAALDPELPLLLSRFQGDRALRSAMVRERRAAGIRGPLSTLRALEEGLILEDAAIEEAASWLPGATVGLSTIEALFGAMRTAFARDAFLEALCAASFSLAEDLDGDSWTDCIAAYAGGSLVTWKEDAGQDGAWDLELSFAEGLPVRAFFAAEGLSGELEFGPYPLVDEATLRFPGGKTSRFLLSPADFPLPLVALDRSLAGTLDGGPRFPLARRNAAVSLPGEAMLLAASYQRTDADPAAPGERVEYELAGGVPVQALRRVDGRVRSLYAYVRGALSEEKLDADGDGRFESRLSYAVGPSGGSEPLRSRTDADGDGVFEAEEEYVFPFAKRWDFDADGAFDCEYEKLEGGGSRARFFPGTALEVSVVCDPEGRALTVTRKDKSLAVIADAGPGLYWIGSKPFDLGAAVPPSDGYYDRAGRHYLLVTVGKFRYAELTP